MVGRGEDGNRNHHNQDRYLQWKEAHSEGNSEGSMLHPRTDVRVALLYFSFSEVKSRKTTQKKKTQTHPLMFHNKGEADESVLKLLLPSFLVFFLTTDLSFHLSGFSLWLCTQPGASPGKSYLTLTTLLMSPLWETTEVRSNAIFSHTLSATITLFKNTLN